MTAAMQTALAAREQRQLRLVELRFDSGTQYHTTAHKDIVWGGHTWLAGLLLAIKGVSESLAGRTNSVTIHLSGADQASLATALSEPFAERQVVIYRGALDATGVLVADPFVEFAGRIEKPGFREDPVSGSAELVWHVASQLSRFDEVNGRRTTDADHQVLFPGDRFFDFVSRDLSEAPWGRP